MIECDDDSDAQYVWIGWNAENVSEMNLFATKVAERTEWSDEPWMVSTDELNQEHISRWLVQGE